MNGLFLLRNQDEFELWKKRNIFDGDRADQPKEFPCYVKKIVLNWDLQYEKAEYLYISDIKRMLSDMKNDRAN